MNKLILGMALIVAMGFSGMAIAADNGRPNNCSTTEGAFASWHPCGNHEAPTPVNGSKHDQHHCKG